MKNLWARIQGKYCRTGVKLFHRKDLPIPSGGPSLISFTFDDFPRSALHAGGDILRHFDKRGTYYAALGLMGKVDAAGQMFEQEDLHRLIAEGHELGCHTFDHLDSWTTATKNFEESILRNRNSMRQILPDHALRSFSYPISPPRIRTKGRVHPHFDYCRGGGQQINCGVTDSNYLSAYFIEKTRDNPEMAKAAIRENVRVGGWLIFATHDVCDHPSPYGCTQQHFEDIVKASVESGAEVVPVIEAWERLSGVSRQSTKAPQGQPHQRQVH